MMWSLLIYSTQDFPPWGDPATPASKHVSPHYIEQAMSETSVPNIVTAVLAGVLGQGVMTYVMTATPISMNVDNGFSLQAT